MKRVAWMTALVAGTLTAVSLLYRLRMVAALMALAIVLAAAIRPMTTALIRHRVPRGLALLLAYLAAAAAPAVVMAILLPRVSGEVTALLDGLLPSYDRHLVAWRAGSGRTALLAAWLPPARTLASMLAQVRPAVLVGGAWQFTLILLQGLAAAILVVVLSVSWSVHREPIMSGIAALIPAQHRPLFRQLASDLGVGVGLHVFGEACKSLVALAVVVLALAALGAPTPVLPALLVAVLRMVPIAGLGLSMVVVVLAAAPLGTLWAALAAPATLLLLVGLQNNIPRLLRSREYNPLLVAFVALLLASTIGWIGLIVAPALAATVQIVIEAAFRAHQDAALPTNSIADIRGRFEQLAAEAMAKKGLSRRTLGLLTNLGRLIDDVEQLERSARKRPRDPSRFAERAA